MASPVVLHHKDEFLAAIADLKVSPRAEKVLQSTRLVALSGLAGGGRNTVINYLVTNHNYVFLVSDTTRPPKLRNGVMEKDGVSYYFRSEEEMLADIRAGEFIEAEIIHDQQVSGTSIRELERAAKTGKIPIHDFEYLGAQNVAAAKPDADIIGLVPPSYEVWIKRFRSREEIHEQEFMNRLQTAEKVLTSMLTLSYFKIILNDTVEQCAAEVREAVENKAIDPAKQVQNEEIAQAILEKVRQALHG